jgi:hypothetical protein
MKFQCLLLNFECLILKFEALNPPKKTLQILVLFLNVVYVLFCYFGYKFTTVFLNPYNGLPIYSLFLLLLYIPAPYSGVYRSSFFLISALGYWFIPYS